MAVYNHFTSQVDGTYHFWPSAENEGQPRIRRVNNDPIKIYNAYGWAICGQQAHMLYAIWTAAGLKARLYGLPGHALCEVFYDGRWHHYDVDMWSWFRTPRGPRRQRLRALAERPRPDLREQEQVQPLQPARPRPGRLRRHVLQGRRRQWRHRQRPARLGRPLPQHGLPTPPRRDHPAHQREPGPLRHAQELDRVQGEVRARMARPPARALRAVPLLRQWPVDLRAEPHRKVQGLRGRRLGQEGRPHEKDTA